MATGGYSVPYSHIEDQQERSIPRSGKEPTSDIPPLLGQGSLPSTLPPWLTKSGAPGPPSARNLPSNGTTHPSHVRVDLTQDRVDLTQDGVDLKSDLDTTTHFIVMVNIYRPRTKYGAR